MQEVLLAPSSEDILLQRETVQRIAQKISPRDMQIARMRSRGATFKQIGEEFGVSTGRAHQIFAIVRRKARDVVYPEIVRRERRREQHIIACTRTLKAFASITTPNEARNLAQDLRPEDRLHYYK